MPDIAGSCQKTRAVARLEISYWQRQLPELKKKGADHFSHLSGSYIITAVIQTVFSKILRTLSQLSEDCRTQHPDVITAALEGHEEFYEGNFFNDFHKNLKK